MNTERSDKFIAEWTKKVNPLKRASETVHRTFNTSPEKLFPLLCPTTEYDWIPHWKCDLLHSESGCAEFNCIFRTTLFGTDEVWVCTRFEPNKAIDYTRYANDVCSKLEISLTDNHDGTVTGRWVMTASALTENGNSVVGQLQAGKRHLEQLIDALEHYVNAGQMIA